MYTHYHKKTNTGSSELTVVESLQSCQNIDGDGDDDDEIINAVPHTCINITLSPKHNTIQNTGHMDIHLAIETSTTLVLFLPIIGTAVPLRMARTLAYTTALSKMDNRNGTVGKIQD
jgi:hypothetical protein